VAPLAAGALRLTTGEVSNALQTSPSGSIAVIGLLLLPILVAAVLARPGGWLDSWRGLPGAPGYLPPSLTVAPLVWSARLTDRAADPLRRLADSVRRHPLLAATAVVAAALAMLNSALR